MEHEERVARPLPPPPPYPPAPPLFPFIKRHKRLLVAALVVLTPFLAYGGYHCVMDLVGYRGSGTVDDMASLPYGFGELFDGLEAEGEVHYAYKTGRRGARCDFTGSADAEHVKAFCSDANGWESWVLDGEVTARKETRDGLLTIRYTHADKRFKAYASQNWRGLRRKRWAD